MILDDGGGKAEKGGGKKIRWKSRGRIPFRLFCSCGKEDIHTHTHTGGETDKLSSACLNKSMSRPPRCCVHMHTGGLFRHRESENAQKYAATLLAIGGARGQLDRVIGLQLYVYRKKTA